MAAKPSTLGDWLHRAEKLYARHEVALGQVATTAHDEALYLLLHTLGLPLDSRPSVLERKLTPEEQEKIAEVFRRRLEEHVPAAYLTRLTEASLRTPESASKLLRAYPEPRSYWRDAVYQTKVPLLYVVRPRWVAQGENLVRNRPDTEMEVFDDAGHALFVDEPARFNSVTEQFLRRHVWP